jgi:hypothetical protein
MERGTHCRGGDRLRSLGLALAVAGGLAQCGRDAPTRPSPPPPPTTLAPATLAELSAAVTSTEGGRRIGCREDVHAEVSLTNRSRSAVLVTGVRKVNSTRTQGCRPVDDFTYQVVPRLVAGGSTVTVMNTALYTGGSGCCIEPGRCGGTCVFVETFEVATEVGLVPAGSFDYTVEFGDCIPCGASSSSAGQTCPPGAAPR